MKRTRTLIVIGCACVAMMMSTTAFAMPGATSLVTVEPKTAASQDQNINETAQSTEAAQTVSLEAMGQTAAEQARMWPRRHRRRRKHRHLLMRMWRSPQ